MKKVMRFWLQIGLVLLISAFFFHFWLVINTSNIFSSDTLFTIKKGESLKIIAQNLAKEGFISSPFYFRLFVFFSGQSRKIRAGIYDFGNQPTIKSITRIITDEETLAKNYFAIIEGESLAEIEEKLKKRNFVSESFSFANYTLENFFTDDLKEIFDGAPLNSSLEGYLFPDTYHLVEGLNDKEIIFKFLRQFSLKLNEELRTTIKKQEKTIYEILIMASMIEKEVPFIEDRRLVSGILWKRLKEEMPLQVDATICYLKNHCSRDCYPLEEKDYKIDSPFNTYLYKGLPPAPIANPGLEAIEAAVYPQTSPFWYYLSDLRTKKTIFSQTYTEHQKAIKKYLTNN